MQLEGHFPEQRQLKVGFCFEELLPISAAGQVYARGFFFFGNERFEAAFFKPRALAAFLLKVLL